MIKMRKLFFFFVFFRNFVAFNGFLMKMKKGRNKDLIELRDQHLCRRYHFWTEVQRLRFDDALKILSQQEFFISEERIVAIIRRKGRELEDLAAVKPRRRVRLPRLTERQLELFDLPSFG